MNLSLHPLVLCLFSILAVSPGLADIQETIVLNNGHEIDIEKYSSNGTNLLLWLPSDHGLTSGLRTLASELAKQGTEVWIADPFTTWFLPATADSLDKIEREDYLQLMNSALATNKTVTLGSNDKGAAVLLETANLPQSAKYAGSLAGAVIISPNLYRETPGSGQEADFTASAYTTNLNMLLIIPKKSTAYLRAEEIQNVLSMHGNTVYLQILPEIRDRFFFREDATAAETKASTKLVDKIINAIQLLKKTPSTNLEQVAVADVPMIEKPVNNNTGKLLAFKGNWSPENFSLTDLNNVRHTLSQYQGKVTLINFWASWCPPCIHEIPSMTMLQESFGNDVKILAINLGEGKDAITTFLQDHPVNFTVLLDPGQAQPKSWKVFAFPTSYLLDTHGSIRYAVAGAIDWNDTSVKEKVAELIKEQ